MIHLDPTRRGEAIAAGWVAYSARAGDCFDAYLAACADWDVIAVVADEVIGALFAKGGVIHLGIVPAWRGRWASRRVIREMLKFGKTTTLLPDETNCADFIRRLDFERVGDELHWGHI